ncbi:MAG: fatty acid desaturase [Myxococcota bacterium]
MQAQESAAKAHLASHLGRDDKSGARVVLSTFAVYFACLALATWSLFFLGGAPGALLFTVGTLGLALAQVRAFLVHHDLCHGALFARPWLRMALAPVVGALASTSPSVWSREHNRHHRDSNKLDRSQDGQTAAWTVRQYRAAPRWQRGLYWLVNQRPVLFLLIPPLYFLGFMRLRARLSENLVFAAFATALWFTQAWVPFLVALFPATWFGFLLFHAQHTFPGVYRRPSETWDFYENAMRGSSILVLPPSRALRWFLYGVGVHALHHLSPAVPGFRLEKALAERPELYAAVPRVSLGQALSTTKYVLYDEDSAQLVTFATAAAPGAHPSGAG